MLLQIILGMDVEEAGQKALFYSAFWEQQVALVGELKIVGSPSSCPHMPP